MGAIFLPKGVRPIFHQSINEICNRFTREYTPTPIVLGSIGLRVVETILELWGGILARCMNHHLWVCLKIEGTPKMGVGFHLGFRLRLSWHANSAKKRPMPHIFLAGSSQNFMCQNRGNPKTVAFLLVSLDVCLVSTYLFAEPCSGMQDAGRS